MYTAAVYGKGVYFARDASYSAHDLYSPLDPISKCKYMFLVKVLTGEFAIGSGDAVQPPQRKSGTGLYDSCVNNMYDPTIFVIFHDTQAYPEYLITFI